jgi:hypothetical protein
MTDKQLSPAAQAVLDAFICCPIETSDQFALAAALRAVADQVVPKDYDHWDGRDGEYWSGYEFGQNERNAYIRSQILTIANELEGK